MIKKLNLCSPVTMATDNLTAVLYGIEDIRLVCSNRKFNLINQRSEAIHEKRVNWDSLIVYPHFVRKTEYMHI